MCTALHIAVNKGYTDVVRVLTEHSADVNLQVRGPRVSHTKDWPLINPIEDLVCFSHVFTPYMFFDYFKGKVHHKNESHHLLTPMREEFCSQQNISGAELLLQCRSRHQ